MNKKGKHMNRKVAWTWTVFIIVVILFIYSWSSYISLFRKVEGYIYHPGTDQIWEISLKPSLDNRNKWDPFIPLKTLYYGEIDFVMFLGNFDSLLIEINADRELRENDPDSWRVKKEKEIDSLIKDLKRMIYSEKCNFIFTDIVICSYGKLRIEDSFPDSLQFLSNYLKKDPPDIFSTDIVVVDWGKDEIPQSKILKNAMVIRGKAAKEMRRKWFNELEID